MDVNFPLSNVYLMHALFQTYGNAVLLYNHRRREYKNIPTFGLEFLLRFEGGMDLQTEVQTLAIFQCNAIGMPGALYNHTAMEIFNITCR